MLTKQHFHTPHMRKPDKPVPLQPQQLMFQSPLRTERQAPISPHLSTNQRSISRTCRHSKSLYKPAQKSHAERKPLKTRSMPHTWRKIRWDRTQEDRTSVMTCSYLKRIKPRKRGSNLVSLVKALQKVRKILLPKQRTRNPVKQRIKVRLSRKLTLKVLMKTKGLNSDFRLQRKGM